MSENTVVTAPVERAVEKILVAPLQCVEAAVEEHDELGVPALAAGDRCGFSSFAHIIGDRVSATNRRYGDRTDERDGEFREKAPVSPVRNTIGRYTATSTTVIAMMGLASSRAARIAALRGFMPSSR